MSDVEKMRANARHCLRNADDAPNDEMARTWLEMAETWLGMIPEAQRTAEETFQTMQCTRTPPRHGTKLAVPAQQLQLRC